MSISNTLITDSDDYCPSIDTDGKYIDRIPSFSNIPQGLRCPCSGKTYNTRQQFASHIKTATHTKHIDSLNANRINHFAELENAQQVVKEQKILIGRLERDIAKLEHDKRRMLEMIHFLTDMKTTTTTSQIDLLDFD